jgi:hypothetical protein
MNLPVNEAYAKRMAAKQQEAKEEPQGAEETKSEE